MFPAHRPCAAASTTGIVLTLATAAALAAGPIASATARPVPEPSTTQPTQTRWQATVHEIAAEAPSTNSLAVRRMLHRKLAQVRKATAKFHRVDAAIAAGYELGWVNGSGVRILTGCVSDPTAGAMGYHYFNAKLMADNAVNTREPEALVYAPTRSGGLRLVAVEWVVRSAQSNPPGVSEPPTVLGMKMHILVPPPGPAFYLLHAWLWKHNPSGMFADWNPKVSCS
ncbi:MAG: hypothetical protein ABI692_07025 [Terracoccus sp.]